MKVKEFLKTNKSEIIQGTMLGSCMTLVLVTLIKLDKVIG